jgi:hypothetical protein
VGDQDKSRPIAKSELWLFPNFTETPRDERWYEITLGFVFTLQGFNRPVEAQVEDILWRGSDECIMVDLTPQAKIIDRKLRKRNLNETIVRVTVTVHHKEEYHGSDRTVKEWQNACSTLSRRTSNSSFLVVKYFSDENSESSTESRVRRRSGEEPQPATNSSAPECCSVREFRVKLQDVYGDWVAAPTEPVDVGICSGVCNVEKHPEHFSPRALLKDRVRNLYLESGLSPVPEHHFKLACTPLTTEPIRLLTYVPKAESYVLFMMPIKAKTCSCR